MKRALWLAVGLAACGEPAEEAHPRCEDQPNTSWRCAFGSYQPQIERCVDGQIEEDTCGASEWCLSVATAEAPTVYEGRCLSRAIEGRCAADGSCPDNLVCWRGSCHFSCNSPGASCLIEGQICTRGVVGDVTPESLCYDEDDL